MDEINVLNFKDEAQTESFKLKLFWRRSESSKPFEEGWDIYLSYCNTPETLQALLDTWPKCLRIISGFCFNESDRKRVQETEEQGDDEDIFAKARAVLDNLETGIPSASSNMDFVKLNETLLCIRSYLVNSVDEVLLDDVVQGRFYELCQSILPYMHKEDRIEGPILSMFVDQYENSVKDLSQIRDKRDRIEALNHIISHTPDPRAAFKIQVADALQDLTTASNELMQAEQERCEAQAKVNRCVQKKNEAKAFADGLLQQNEEVSRQSESLSRSEEEMKNLTIEVVFTEEKIRNNWSLIRNMLDNFQFEE